MQRRLIASALLLILVPFVAQAATPCPFIWNSTLQVGSTGEGVVALQQFLQVTPATGYFGALTKQAVIAFQEKNNIMPIGIAGPQTRAALNAQCGANASIATSSASTTTPVSGTASDTLTLSDPGQPASSIAPSGAGVNFITFTLAAGSRDVTVNSITVERVGFANDQAFAAIALTDPNGLQIGNQFALASNHQVVFKTPFVVPANSSETFTIVGYMAPDLTDYDGQMATLQIDAIDATSPLSGSLPLRGSTQTLNSTLQIGSASVSLSSLDPDGAQTHYIGNTGVRFSAIRMTANSVEDITLSYMIWDQSGTAGQNDVGNVQTVVGTTSYPALVQPDGHTYISLFNPAIVIPKGQSIDISVQGDLSNTGANRTVEFDLYDNTDDEGTGGATYGFGVGVVPSGNTAALGSHSAFITSDGTTNGSTGVPFFAGSVTTISPGALIYISR